MRVMRLHAGNESQSLILEGRFNLHNLYLSLKDVDHCFRLNY